MKFFYLFLCLVSFVYAEEGAPFERGSDSEADNEKKSPHEFTGNLTFISDYRSRGISQTFCRPSIQGELKYKFIPAGYYVKTQGFNVDGTSVYLNDTSLEWDFFAGIENEIGDFGYDAGFIYYYYPGGESFVPRRCSYDTLESYLGVSYKGLEVKLWITLDDFFATNSHNLPFN